MQMVRTHCWGGPFAPVLGLNFHVMPICGSRGWCRVTQTIMLSRPCQDILWGAVHCFGWQGAQLQDVREQ